MSIIVAQNTSKDVSCVNVCYCKYRLTYTGLLVNYTYVLLYVPVFRAVETNVRQSECPQHIRKND